LKVGPNHNSEASKSLPRMVCTGDALAISAKLFLSISIVMMVARLVGMVFRYFKQVSLHFRRCFCFCH